MYKKLSTFLLTLSISITISLSQSTITLNGYLLDADNGETLISAAVIVETMNTGTTTNEYGYYSISIKPGKYKFRFTYIGYEPVIRELTLSENKRLDIELKPSVISAEEVVVVSERENDNVQSTEMSIAKLDVKAIEKVPVVLGEPDILKTIQLMPGISSASESSSGINVRGGAADQNLVLLDESQVFNVSHLFGFFSVFNSNALKDVKVFKGGIPAKYGGRLSSVIDIRQKDGNSKKYNFSGSLGSISSKFLAEGPIQKGKSSFMLAGRRSYGDLILKLLGENDNTAYFYDLNLKANYVFGENDKVFIGSYLGRDKFDLTGLFGSSWGNGTFSLRWNHLFSNKMFHNFTFAYSNYDYSLDFLPSGFEYNWKSKIINWTAKSDLTYFLSDDYVLNLGLSGVHYSFEPGSIKPISNSSVLETKLDKKFAVEFGAYFSIDSKLSDKLSLNTGLRVSNFYRIGSQTVNNYENNLPVVYNHRFGRYEKGIVTGRKTYKSGELFSSYTGLEPRLSARYTIDDLSSLKLSYNRTYQYIHLLSNSTSPTPLDIWVPSGTYIKPQIGDQLALGYFRNFDNNTYEASIELFYKKMQNQIDYVDGADLKINNYIETQLLKGSGRAYGAELSLKKSKGILNWWLSYTYSKSERQVGGVSADDPGINNGKYYPVSYDKTHDLSLTFIYNFSKKWIFSSNFVLTSGRAITYPKSRYQIMNLIVPQYENRNQDRLPVYHRLDLSATLKDSWGGDWIFSIYNVYNRRNANAIRFRQNENNKEVSEAVKTYMFGLMPGLTYNFKF